MVRLLLIDDSRSDRLLAIRALQRGFSDLQVEEISEAAELARALDAGNFDLVITDYRLGWSNGIKVFWEIKSHYPDCPVIMFTSSGNEEVAVEAMKAGLDDYILKSHQHLARLPIAVRSVLQLHQERTERKQVEAAFQQSQAQVEALERLHRLKDDFLSTVSHELRTPIATMKMAIQMLKVAADEERRWRYLHILQTECDREATLIDDLLDLQKLEISPYSTSTPEPTDIQAWLPAMLEPFQVRTQKQQQQLEVTIPSDLPVIAIDRDRLARILAELLNNACKYTPAQKRIQLHLQHLVASKLIEFKVCNQAEIPAEELPHVFQKFYRVPKSDPWRQGGTGLGLALVEKLVEQLQGVIYVTSEAGWTTFLLHLPIADSAAACSKE
ncbi:MAG: hypothetical protein Kow00121_10740 [Elainellaceae cyanobacterium]